jgi:putative membrane protein (TIGR04086 family)
VSDIDRRAVGAGALVALVIAVPPTLVAQALNALDVIDDGSAWLVLFLPIVLAGFFAGGYAAARRSTDTPFAHGALAALLAFVTVQVIGVVRQLVAGDSIAWAGIVFNALLSACVGTLGAMVAIRKVEAR